MSVGTESTSGPPPPPGGEYSTVSLGSAWGMISLACFAASMAANQLVSLLPPHLQGRYLLPPLVVRIIPALTLVGILLGVIGLRRERRRTLALLGIVLNGIVLVLVATFMIGFWWVRLR